MFRKPRSDKGRKRSGIAGLGALGIGRKASSAKKSLGVGIRKARVSVGNKTMKTGVGITRSGLSGMVKQNSTKGRLNQAKVRVGVNTVKLGAQIRGQ